MQTTIPPPPGLTSTSKMFVLTPIVPLMRTNLFRHLEKGPRFRMDLSNRTSV